MSAAPDRDPYARSAAWRWVALSAALLAWTFDGMEQAVYTIVTRPALQEIVPGVPERSAASSSAGSGIATAG